MSALTSLMTRFCAGEDNWLARQIHNPEDPGTSEVRDGNGKPRRNKNKRRHNNGDAEDMTVNVGFRNPKSGQRKKPSKGSLDGPTTLDKIMDRPCQIHGTQDKPATHTNCNCWVFKLASKLAAEERGKSPRSEDDDEPRGPSNGGQTKFPPEVKP